jgi:hypothetical protein
MKETFSKKDFFKTIMQFKVISALYISLFFNYSKEEKIVGNLKYHMKDFGCLKID